MPGWIQNCDYHILLWIQEHLRNPFLTPIVKAITHLGDAGWFWIVLTLVLLMLASYRKVGWGMAAALILSLIVTNLLLKNLVARVRPYDAYETIKCLVAPEKDLSFPSGHSSASFAAAVAFYRGKKGKIGWCLIALAILIALTRLYVGVHFPTDVLGGTLVGIGAGFAGPALVNKFYEMKEKRKQQ